VVVASLSVRGPAQDELRARWLPLGALLLPDAEAVVLEESRSSVRTSKLELELGDDGFAIDVRERPER
jgi:hypothetical protein